MELSACIYVSIYIILENYVKEILGLRECILHSQMLNISGVGMFNFLLIVLNQDTPHPIQQYHIKYTLRMMFIYPYFCLKTYNNIHKKVRT